MYLQILSTSDFETEKAAADSCQENLPALSLFSFMNLSELSATIVAKVSSDIFGKRETIKCTCSGLAYIAYSFESLLFTIPVMYFSILFCSLINGKRFKVMNIKCVYRLLYSIFMIVS